MYFVKWRVIVRQKLDYLDFSIDDEKNKKSLCFHKL